MEENNQTMNLSSIAQSGNTFNTPITNTTNSNINVTNENVNNESTIIGITAQGQLNTSIQTTPIQVPNNETETNPIDNAPTVTPVETDKYIAKTKELSRMISTICKVANHDSNNPISELIILKFSNEGLELLGCNSSSATGDNGTFVCEKSKTYIYKNELSFGIDSVQFPMLLSKITTEDVTFEYDAENRIITIIADGQYQFPEAYDHANGESAKIQIPEEYINIQTKPFEAVELKKLVKMANTFALNIESDSRFSSVYSSDNVYASNAGNVIYIHENVPSLKDVTFYFQPIFVQAFLDQELDKNNEIGFIYNTVENYISKIIIKGDNYLIAGPTKSLEDLKGFPVDEIKSLYAMNFTESTVFNKNSLIPTLERVQIFMDIGGDDHGELLFNCNQNVMEVKSVSSTASETIKLDDCNFTQKIFRLKVTDILNALKTLETDNITMKFDPTFNEAICLTDGASVILLAVMVG